MRRPQRDETRETTDRDTRTVRIGDSDGEDDDLAPLVRGGRRTGLRLWWPLLAFLVLIVVGVVVLGRFIVASNQLVPDGAGATATDTVPTGPPIAVTPSLPDLPTPPPRPADAINGWATRISAATEIPVVATEAYGYAQLLLQREKPACHLGWTTLAGIGKIESDHGRAGGAVLGPSGRSTPPINGPALDGKNGRPLVKDTDAGAYDADPTFDHMMGPLHLLPSVWVVYEIDADGDGILDPYDIDDASAALGRYLCSGPENLSTRAGWNAAIDRYRPGDEGGGNRYEASVFAAADSYGQLTRSIG